MAEFRPSVEISKDITSLETQINSVTKTLETLERPFVTLKSLSKQIEELKTQIDNEKDGVIIARLKKQLDSVIIRLERVKKLITKELEVKIKDTYDSLEKLKVRLVSLNKELAESLKIEEEIRIRASKTIVSLVDLSSVYGGILSRLSLTIEPGQKVEYLTSLDSGNTYMKISKSNIDTNFSGEIKTVDYKSIFILENKENTESQTSYRVNTFEFKVNIVIGLNTGFILSDFERGDGDLSIWALISNDLVKVPL